MAVAAVVQDDVQIHQGIGGEGLPEIFDEFAVELADFVGGNGNLKHEGVPAAEIDGRGDQRFFHRQREVAVAADAGFVAEGLLERLADGDADVFDGVVLIDVQIALGLHVQIDGCMLGQKREHVIEKTDAGGDVADARAIEIELDADLRFSGFAIDGGGAGHGERFAESESFKSVFQLYHALQQGQAGIDLLVGADGNS